MNNRTPRSTTSSSFRLKVMRRQTLDVVSQFLAMARRTLMSQKVTSSTRSACSFLATSSLVVVPVRVTLGTIRIRAQDTIASQ